MSVLGNQNFSYIESEGEKTTLDSWASLLIYIFFIQTFFKKLSLIFLFAHYLLHRKYMFPPSHSFIQLIFAV